jgi:hypothetical protein
MFGVSTFFISSRSVFPVQIFFIQIPFFLSPAHTKTMSEETKEKRFDDYSQDENVERHTRKNRWVSVDIGGKP